MTITQQIKHDVQRIEEVSTAREKGVSTLYKFMSYPPREDANSKDNDERRRRVVCLLRNGELYFALAQEMNDPFEASPHFRLSETFNEEDAANFKRKWREHFRSGFPMCCLSASRCSTLMWSYYSDGHKGICIHIDATQEPFASAFYVNYKPLYPKISERDGKLDHEIDELLKRMFLTKSKVWDHEKEYRLINMPLMESNHILDNVFEWKQLPQLAVVPPSFIVGVTVGACMDNQEIEEIKHICGEREIKIPVFKANCKHNQFDLEFQQIF